MEQVLVKRKVTVRPQAGQAVSFETDVKTYGELRTQMRERGVSVSLDGNVVYDMAQRQYSSDGALLPSEEFQLFIFPAKSKGGATRSEILAQVKALIQRDGDAAKAFFSPEDPKKNYTNVPSHVLTEKLAQYGQDTPVEPEVQVEESGVETQVVSNKELDALQAKFDVLSTLVNQIKVFLEEEFEAEFDGLEQGEEYVAPVQPKAIEPDPWELMRNQLRDSGAPIR